MKSWINIDSLMVEKNSLHRYYGIGEESDSTLAEIGHHMDITRERVRQIKDRALKKLRKKRKNRILKEYIIQS